MSEIFHLHSCDVEELGEILPKTNYHINLCVLLIHIEQRFVSHLATRGHHPFLTILPFVALLRSASSMPRLAWRQIGLARTRTR